LINPSFEDPPPGEVWPFSRWIVPGGQSDSVGDGSQNSAVTGWIGVGGPGFVERNPTSAEFPGAAGNGALPSPADGSQAAFNSSTSNKNVAVLDDPQVQPAITLQPHKIYTLTVAFGQALNDPVGLGHFAGFGLEVMPTEGSLISLTPSPADYPAPGTFKDFVLQFNSDDYIGSTRNGPWAGDGLLVSLILGAGTYADNVRLDVSDVPEPSMLVLLASGLIGLSAYGWRRRIKAL
jgi:hypothetical protein